MSIGFDGNNRYYQAWEITPDDVETVLDEYDLVTTENVEKGFDIIDADEVVKAVLSYTDFDDQMNASFATIEEILRREKIVPSDREQVWKAA